MSKTHDTARNVIQSLGGLTATARAMGYPVTTVQGWQDRGSIPVAHWYQLIDEAAKVGIVLTVEDFIPQPRKEETD